MKSYRAWTVEPVKKVEIIKFAIEESGKKIKIGKIYIARCKTCQLYNKWLTKTKNKDQIQGFSTKIVLRWIVI